MIIHVIEAGETVDTIADLYGVSADWINREYTILDPNDLAVGGTLVILYPAVTHTVVEGDTLISIADMYGVTVMSLLRNNSYLSIQEQLTVGDVLVIEYEDEKKSNLAVFGYSYHFTEEKVLQKTLPFLTYLIIFGCSIGENGIFKEMEDARIIQYSKIYGVAPIMIITFQDKGVKAGTNIINLILNDDKLRCETIERIIDVLVKKGYSGISIGSVYVYPSDRELFIEFVEELIDRVHDLGLLFIDTVVLSTFGLVSDVFSTQNYTNIINQLSDSSVVFPYSVGITSVAPIGIASYNALIDMMHYILDYIDVDKFQLGINTVGYIWEIPYVPGISEGNAISVNSAIQLARDYNIPILFDVGTQAAFFIYEDGDREFLIRFRDARSIVTLLSVVDEFFPNGIGVWNTTTFFNALWLIVNSQYYIDKVDL